MASDSVQVQKLSCIDNSASSDVEQTVRPNSAMSISGLEESGNMIDNEIPENEINHVMNLNENYDQNVRGSLDSSPVSSPFGDSVDDPDFQSDDSNESSSTEERSQEKLTEKQITRKRGRAPWNWQRNICKKMRNSGEEYQTLSKGKTVEKRKILHPCNDKCRVKCTEKFTDEDREIIFNNFWKLGDLQKQRSFVLSSMITINRKYQKVNTQKCRERGCNKAYYYSKNEVRVRVCQKFFLTTLGITERFIRTVVSKSKDGFLEEEKRGKNKKSNVSDEVKDGIREHLQTIPAIESHYTRANTSKKYIDGSKTLTDLYNDYKAWCAENSRPHGTMSMYRYIFNYEFNMCFHIPKKDQCSLCTTYQNSNLGEKEKMKEEFEYHIREKDLSRVEKTQDKEKINENFMVACFDLQAALPVPRGDVSCFYYKSRLNCYNFTICELENKGLGNVECFFWHEGEGKRGSIEIGTCILTFLRKKSESANSDNYDVVLYSDNCGGQGKNKFIITMFLYAVTHYKIRSITHKFFVVGHGQNEGDCSHSIIEKNIKKTLKGGPVFVPAHYATIIRSARKSGSPFTVNEMAHDDFWDLKGFTNSVANRFNKNTDEESFNFNDISIIRVERDHPDRYFYKTSYSDTTFKSVKIKSETKSTRRSTDIKTFELTTAYEESLPVSKRKIDDLKSLILNRSIPRAHSHFYEQLKCE